MIVLDTNVISEVVRPRPDERVVAWLESLSGPVAITAITLAELMAGLGRLPNGRRKAELTTRIESVLEEYRGPDSVLPFDDSCASHYAEVFVTSEKAGLPISMADAQIAAICLRHDAVLGTRNVKDFVHTGVDLVDPWSTLG